MRIKMNMLKFEESRDITPIWEGSRITELVPGPVRAYVRLGSFRLRIPHWVLELAR